MLRHQIDIEKNDALLEEIRAFVRCIIDKSQPLVTAEEGKSALATAAQITNLIEHHISQHDTTTSYKRLSLLQEKLQAIITVQH